MKTEDLKRAIMKMSKGNEFHGYEVHKRLESQGVEVEMGRLYRVLNEMLEDKLLESRWVKSQFGPKKRVYRLGKKAVSELDKILADAIETVHIFYGEYLLSLPPETSIFDRIAKHITENMKAKDNIVYVTPTYSMTLEKSLQSFRREVPSAKIYLVKPPFVEAKPHVDNLSILDGSHGNIPLKDRHADLEVIAYVPKKDTLQEAIKEWGRVLKEDGTLAILVPSALMNEFEDPLSIGDFVEKYEREELRTEEYADRETTESLLRGSFRRVEESRFVHMTVFVASRS